MGKKFDWSLLMGAAFLMATSSIGPGFVTQTTVFTQTLMASFGFVILLSVILDIGAQLNVWRIIGISGKRGQDISNMVVPGLGYVVSFLIVLGGLAFNIGNIGGCGLGLQVLFGIDPKIGAIISAIIGISIFLVKEAGKVMDRFTQIAGFIMIVLTLYVVISSNPPVGEAVAKTFMPDTMDYSAIITLLGGTVGGYIVFSGGHRLIDAGVVGKEALPQITRSSVTGICITGVMRVLLFLATLGVITGGFVLDKANPPASVFLQAAGMVGYKIFGIVLWSAAISSVIGCAYTSVSFIRTFSAKLEANYRWLIIGFIIFSTLVFVIVGRPVFILVIVGTLNGLILPITLAVMLIAAHKKSIVGTYKHPLWMTIFGIVVVVLTTYMCGMTLLYQLPKLMGIA